MFLDIVKPDLLKDIDRFAKADHTRIVWGTRFIFSWGGRVHLVIVAHDADGTVAVNFRHMCAQDISPADHSAAAKG